MLTLVTTTVSVAVHPPLEVLERLDDVELLDLALEFEIGVEVELELEWLGVKPEGEIELEEIELLL